MNKVLNRGLFFLLMLLVVVSPLPLGSNREWSWSLCALIAGVLGLVWVVVNLGAGRKLQFADESVLVPVFIHPGLRLGAGAD